MSRLLVLAATLLLACSSARAEEVLRVGDQKGNSQAVMEAAGVLKDVPYKIEWKEFPAAAPLLEALGAGAIETGVVGDAPFTFAAAANVSVKAIGAAYRDIMGRHYPTMAVVEVSALIEDRAKIEIEATAVIPD